jgi:hypothetical protein
MEPYDAAVPRARRARALRLRLRPRGLHRVVHVRARRSVGATAGSAAADVDGTEIGAARRRDASPARRSRCTRQRWRARWRWS